MPRTYRFDHFTAGQNDSSRIISEEEKKHLHEGGGATNGTEIHYGKRHAETEQILAARKMAAQLEESSQQDELESEPELKEMYQQLQNLSEQDVSTAQSAAASSTEQPTIGSVPGTQELPPLGALSALVEQAKQNTRAMVIAARDFRNAATRLLTLPLDAAKQLRRYAHV